MAAVTLIGRHHEVDLLDAAIDGVRVQGRALLITGEPGIGKSSLLHSVTHRARERGSRLLETTGVVSEEGLAFAGLQLLLDPIMSGCEALPAVQRKALATAFGREAGPPPQPFLVGLAALNLLSDVASAQPLLVSVDDAQWLDGPTQEVLAFVARRIGGDPMAMIAVMRTGHGGPLRQAGLDTVALLGLDDVSAREVLAVAASDMSEGDRERILLQALGNPLALVELPTAWRSAATAMAKFVPQLVPLSDRLERAFAARLTELPPVTRDALLVAAVDAEDDLREILAATSVLSGAKVDGKVFEPAVEANLLTFDHARLCFRHPLVKSGILQAESTTRRQAANAALSDVLEHRPLRRTWYRAQATIGPDDQVADELEEAHTENLRRGSVTAAITALERAAQLTRPSAKRGHRLLLAAELGFGLGQADLVSRLLSDAAAQALTDLDRARLEWLRELPDDTDLQGARRIAELCEVAGRAAAASDVDLALNLLVAAAVRCHWGWPSTVVRDQVVAATESLIGSEADPRYLAALAVAQPLKQGRKVEGLLVRAASSGLVDPDGLALCGMAAFAVGDQLRAADFLARSEARCRLEGRMGLLTQVLALRSAVAMDLGDWRDASTAVDEGRRLASETRQPTWYVGTQATIARGHALKGDARLALDLVAELENNAGARGNTCARAGAVLARGFVLLIANRHLEAFDELRRLFDPADPSCHDRERIPGVMFLAEAAVHADRHAEARTIMDRLEGTARQIPSPLLHTQLLYARAVLATDQDAERSYLAALEHDLVRWPLIRALLELAYGSWLRRQRRPREARAFLRSAQETLEWIGASMWVERARSELRATGDRPAGRDGLHPGYPWQDALTAQELQIAQLAAEGLTNREIADRLFMSHRTVSAHLHHIFPKLNVTSRVQLAGLFPRSG